MTTNPKPDLIAEFNTRYWMLFVFISFIYGAILARLWDKSSDIISVIDSLKFSNEGIQKWIIGNWEMVFSVVGLYVTALAFWKFKKGIFSESELKVKFWSGIMLHRIFNLALLTPYMIYLCYKTFPSEYLWLWIILYFTSHILSSSLIEIGDDHRKAVLDRRWVVWILLFLTVMAIWASYTLTGFWEAAIVLFVSWIAFPASNALLKTYTISISSYEAIEKVHELQKEFNKVGKKELLRKGFRNSFFEKIEKQLRIPFLSHSLSKYSKF